MKTTIMAFLASMLVCIGLSAQKMELKKAELDYGSIEKGADGHREFHFTNTGNAPLIIVNAHPSCGCTIPSFPKEPIMPGTSGVIKVKYDTNRVGAFTKFITVTTNDPNQAELRLKIFGEIKDQPAAIPATEGSFQGGH